MLVRSAEKRSAREGGASTALHFGQRSGAPEPREHGSSSPDVATRDGGSRVGVFYSGEVPFQAHRPPT